MKAFIFAVFALIIALPVFADNGRAPHNDANVQRPRPAAVYGNPGPHAAVAPQPALPPRDLHRGPALRPEDRRVSAHPYERRWEHRRAEYRRPEFRHRPAHGYRHHPSYAYRHHPTGRARAMEVSHGRHNGWYRGEGNRKHEYRAHR